MKKKDLIHCTVKGCKNRKLVGDERCEKHIYQKYTGVFSKEFATPEVFDNSYYEEYN